MTVKLELKPDIEAQLTAQANARGISLDAYLQIVIEGLARNEATAAASREDLDATLDALAEMGRDLPRLPSASLSRENIYQDHG